MEFKQILYDEISFELKKKKDVNKEKRRKCSRVQNDLTIYTLLRNT